MRSADHGRHAQRAQQETDQRGKGLDARREREGAHRVGNSDGIHTRPVRKVQQVGSQGREGVGGDEPDQHGHQERTRYPSHQAAGDHRQEHEPHDGHEEEHPRKEGRQHGAHEGKDRQRHQR